MRLSDQTPRSIQVKARQHPWKSGSKMVTWCRMNTQNSLALPSGIVSNVFTDATFTFLKILQSELGVCGYYLVKFLQIGCPREQELADFSVKGQTVNILGFASSTVCDTTMKLCLCSVKPVWTIYK